MISLGIITILEEETEEKLILFCCHFRFFQVSSLIFTKENVGDGANRLQFPSYNNLKWSEGINAPPYGNFRNGNSFSNDTCVDNCLANCSARPADSNYNSLNSIACTAAATDATWHISGDLNLRPDLQSWGASNPMSLPEMYGHDVCDSVISPNDSENKTDNGGNHCDDIGSGSKVTLPNHCPATSGFIAYSRIKECVAPLPPPPSLLQKQPVTQDKKVAKDLYSNTASSMGGGGEDDSFDFLTFDGTHFHPIETFVDGYTFEINSVLDVVEYERDANGYLCLESEQYLEYKRSDICGTDEESVTSASSINSATSTGEGTTLVVGRKESDDGFVVKFRLQRGCEIACQTEENDLELAIKRLGDMSSSQLNVTRFCNVFATSRQANNEAVMAAVTKAVAAATKAATENRLNARHYSWAARSEQVDNYRVWLPDIINRDEVDFSRNSQFQLTAENPNWCQMRRQSYEQVTDENLRLTGADSDRMNGNSVDNTSHTLWGMCAACNTCEFDRSLPANCLLRDELRLEADEIMSDLRYMQDLYIGSNYLNQDAADFSDTEMETENQRTFKCVEEYTEKDCRNQMKEDTDGMDTVQTSMLQKVNQLIEDLLRPSQETTKVLGDKKDEHQTNENNVSTWPLTKCDSTSSLWQFGNQHERNIWQHDDILARNVNDNENRSLKPMQVLLRQVGRNEEQEYLAKLNWEHENLSKIWQQTTPPPPTAATSAAKANRCKQKIEKPIENENVSHSLESASASDTETQEMVEQKNIKNRQNFHSINSAATAASTYKKVQQFFNTSAAKLKMAANRKRRHSASQNFYQQQQQQQQMQENLNLQQNNNNNDAITDLNRYKLSLAEEQLPQQPKQTIITCKYWTTKTNGTPASMDSAAAAMMLLAAASTASNADDLLTENCISNDTTTTATTIAADDGISEGTTLGNTFSYLIDKNTSILKHVTMMARPLTR